MPYISTIEQIGIYKGRQEGRQEGEKRGEQRGRQEGIDKEKHAIAERLLEKGTDVRFVADVTGLPLTEVKTLKKAKHH